MLRRVLFIILLIVIVVMALAAGAAALFRLTNINPVAILENIIGPSADTERLEQIIDALAVPIDIMLVVLGFILAFLISKLSHRLAGWILGAASVAKHTLDSDVYDPERFRAVSARRVTLQQLVASLITFAAFTIATVFALTRFFSLTNLALFATIVANALGFAGRDYVGDLLNGISNLFEDRFDVGDNIEIVRVEEEIRGIVEEVNIRTLSLRTRSGELIVVPQGQVRTLRNFTRGVFTGTDVTVRVPAGDLAHAMTLLVDLSFEAPDLLPDLLQPFAVHSQAGTVSTVSELVINAKATYGHGSTLRLELMSLIQQRLEAAGIALAA
jgi:small conductance mechanosensitive channel